MKRSLDQNYDYETLTPGMGKLKQEQWSRIEREKVVLKKDKELVISGKKKAIVRRETSAVSSTKRDDRAQQTRTHCRHTF